MRQLLEPRVEGILGIQLTIPFPAVEEMPQAKKRVKKKKTLFTTDIDNERHSVVTPNQAWRRRQLSVQECAWNLLAYDPFDKE